MAAQRMLVSLPEELAQRFRSRVAPRQRSAFVQHLLEMHFGPTRGGDDALYHIALAVEQDERLSSEMAEWDITCGDGLQLPPPDRSGQR
jgi:metal-responsive CopG/Arc/MetJ family transcriptional regulator